MPRKAKAVKVAMAALPSIPKKLVDKLVTRPTTVRCKLMCSMSATAPSSRC